MSLAPPPAVVLGDQFARELPELALAWQAEQAPNPALLLLNEPLAAELGLDVDWLRSPAGVRMLLGTQVPEGARPVAQAYAGHQFGGYNPRLGDGRALLLGELTAADGQLRDLHLKGSGATPFSRGGDGRAVVGPMLREYVVSEAMHALGIPTTRSLAVVATGRAVQREGLLPGAVLARVASSHLRVGSFQYARAAGEPGVLRRLADHAVARHHPDAAGAEQPHLELFRRVLAAQAELVARWMLVGFVHGVMNTDNTTISGETIDYGPCAFLEAFDPATVFSSIDESGRYAYGNQPAVLGWNLARLAEAMLPLFDEDQDRAVELAQETLDGYRDQYRAAWLRGMRAKLGLTAAPYPVTDPLVEDLPALLQQARVDHTSFYRRLAEAVRDETTARPRQLPDQPALDGWTQRWLALHPDADLMDRTNPVYVPRNQMLEQALAAATSGDLEPVRRLLGAVTHPYLERPGLDAYARPAPAEFAGYRTFCGT